MAALVCAGVCALTVAGFFGAFGWMFDLASHFRQQYLVVVFLLVIGALALRRWRLGLVLTPFLLVNLAVVGPYYLRSSAPLPAGPTRRFLLANVLILSHQYERIQNLVEETSADVVVLQELSPEWMGALAGLKPAYPHTAGNSEKDRFGIGIWSKVPLRSRVLPASEAGRTSVEAFLEFPEGDLTLVVTHPVPPTGGAGTRLRDEQLSALAQHVSKLTGRVIVLGDLNATPWSHGFREFERISGLRDSSKDVGLTGTWPSFLPGMRIPLDHCLTRGGIKVIRKRAGPFVGSDHLPMIVDMAVR